jgi:hypothetical protein
LVTKAPPNEAPQPTSHAKDGSARHDGFSRVSRLLIRVVRRRGRKERA